MSIRPGYCPYIQGTMMTHHSGALQDDGRRIVSARPQPVDAGDRHYSPLFSLSSPLPVCSAATVHGNKTGAKKNADQYLFPWIPEGASAKTAAKPFHSHHCA